MMKVSLAAAFLALLPASAPAHVEKSETLRIAHPSVAETDSGVTRSAVYMRIETQNGEPDRLVGANSPDAVRVEIHRDVTGSNGSEMVGVDGITIPAEGEAVLAPGGYHIMLIGLVAPLFAETTIPMDLEFEKAGTVEIDVVVEAEHSGHTTGMQDTGHSRMNTH